MCHIPDSGGRGRDHRPVNPLGRRNDEPPITVDPKQLKHVVMGQLTNYEMRRANRAQVVACRTRPQGPNAPYGSGGGPMG